MQIVNVKDNDSSMFKWLNENTENKMCDKYVLVYVCVSVYACANYWRVIYGYWQIIKSKNLTLLLAGL